MDPLKGTVEKGQAHLGNSAVQSDDFPLNLITLLACAKKKKNCGSAACVSLCMSGGKLKSHLTVPNTFHSFTLCRRISVCLVKRLVRVLSCPPSSVRGLFKAHSFLPSLSLDTYCDFKRAAVGSPHGSHGAFSTLMSEWL